MKYLSHSIYGFIVLCLFGMIITTSAPYEQKLLILSIAIQAFIVLIHRHIQKLSYLLPLAFLVLTAIAVYPVAKIHEFSHLSVVITVFSVLGIHYLIFESLVQQELTKVSRFLSVIGYITTTIVGITLLIQYFSLSIILFVLNLYLSFVVSYIHPKEITYKKAGVIVVFSIHTILWILFVVSQRIS